MKSMCVIGVTGGIGAGKSEVLHHLEEHWGARLILLDDLSRCLLDPGGKCVEAAVELLGPGILKEDGTIDRGRTASLIFADEYLRKGLDDIIHPAVKEEALRILKEEEKKGSCLAVIEAALLIEEHYDAFCDEMWYIYADEATRCRRLRETRGYDSERIRATMARQLSEEEFRAHTDFVVDNSGEFTRTAEQIDAHMKELMGAKRSAGG